MTMSSINFTGKYRIVHRDPLGKILSDETFTNLVTDQGLDYIMDSALSAATAITAWYFALWPATPTPAAVDTYAVPNETEITNVDGGIQETTRQAWTEQGVSSQSIDNVTAEAVFTANTTGADVVMGGIGVVGGGTGATTLGNTAGGGTLLSSAAFTGGNKSLSHGDTLTVTYTITGNQG